MKEIDDKFKNLVGMNIPMIQLDCSFTRQELYSIYTKFKALAKISKASFPEKMTNIGVEKSVFMNGLKMLSLDNTDFLEKIFESVDKENKGFLYWEQYFQALKLISSNDLNDKIDLFFKIVDADGNGLFSFDEIKDICLLSLSKIKIPDSSFEQYREDTSDFYARYIFKLLNKQIDDEIPSEEFKWAIFNGNSE